MLLIPGLTELLSFAPLNTMSCRLPLEVLEVSKRKQEKVLGSIRYQDNHLLGQDELSNP